VNYTVYIVGDYMQMMTMKNLGVTTSAHDIDPITAQCFSVIADEIAQISAKNREKQSKAGRKR
jgi:hypothetical protein